MKKLLSMPVQNAKIGDLHGTDKKRVGKKPEYPSCKNPDIIKIFGNIMIKGICLDNSDLPPGCDSDV